MKKVSDNVDIPKAQRHSPALPLAEFKKNCNSHNEVIIAAYATREYSDQRIANFFKIHFSTAGHIVRKAKKDQLKGLLLS